MSQIVQSCFIEEYEFKDKQGKVKKCSLDKKQKLNVRSLYRVLKVLVDEGYGDYGISFGYDSNYGHAGAYNEFHITSKSIEFQE